MTLEIWPRKFQDSARSHQKGKAVTKLLVLRLGSFGDILHTIPALQELARRHPGTEIHWLVDPAYIPFLECVVGIDRVWGITLRSGSKKLHTLRDFRKTARLLREQAFTVAIDFQGLVKSALLGRLVRPCELRGCRRDQVREPLASIFYDERLEVTTDRRHQVEHHLDIAFPPSFSGSASARIEIEIPPESTEYVDRQLEKLDIESPIILNPGGGWPTKLWPAARFGQLASRIETELRVPVFFAIGPGETNLLSEADCSPAPLRTFPTNLVELAALCRRSRLMVAGDTGPMHLAVSQGTPVVAILGPALPWRTGPFNPADAVVTHPRQCPTPYKRTCRDHFCMDIEVDRVFEAVVQRLGLREPERAKQAP